MKKLYVSVLAVLACLGSFATTVTATNGTWNTGIWSPSAPVDGDIIVIPPSVTVTITNNPTLNNVTFRIYGILSIINSNNKLSLGGTWDIAVYTGGSIQGSGKIINTTPNPNTTLYNGTTVSGPKTASSISATFITNTALPVKFTGFSIARQNSDVLVQWSTAEEVNADSYVIERSNDGNIWTGITTVAARGNTSSLTNYTYVDKNVTAAIAYYRVKQVDIDGQYTYTTTKTIKAGAAAVEVKVAAINNRVVLQFSQEVKGAVEVRLVTLGGQVVSREVLHEPVGQVILNSTPAKGSYVVSVSNAQDIHVARQVRF